MCLLCNHTNNLINKQTSSPAKQKTNNRLINNHITNNKLTNSHFTHNHLTNTHLTNMEIEREHYNLPADAVWFSMSPPSSPNPQKSNPLSLVTGCSSGIGKALATLIASKPTHRLVATARNPSSLSYLPASPNILALALDVTSPTAIDSAVATTLSRFGRIDVLINNAAYTYRGDTENARPEQAHHLFNTNFWGVVHLSRHAMRIMREVNPTTTGGQQGGVVINVTSLGGRAAFPGNAFYHASKFAVEGFTESVAREVKPEWGIHFCCVEPGGTQTDFAGRSTVAIEEHPAYEGGPGRMLVEATVDEEVTKTWATADKVAGAMWTIVQGGSVPLRVPLGRDSYALLSAENRKEGERLESWKEFSEAVGGDVEGVKFLSE